jgi:hypothetical protein
VNSFSSYVRELRRLANLARNPQRHRDVTIAIDAALDGGASRALRALVDLDILRDSGAFFTGSRLSRRAARLIAPTLDRDSVILDPACGAGDLLLACADVIPSGRSSQQRVEAWQHQLRGRDISHSFVRAARLRLSLLALRREPTLGLLDEGNAFPELKVRSGMKDAEALEAASHLVLNPPFTLGIAPADCEWASGSVNYAALFLEGCLRNASSGTQVVAILPDVLRSGARYRAWRHAIEKLAGVDHVGLGHQFDRYTDVSVFLLRLRVRERPRLSASHTEGWNTPRRPTGATLGDYFDVSVGPVVDYRDEHRGRWHPFICAKTLKPWTTLRTASKHRRFEGRVLKSPFVAVKRTSRPEDAFRAVATLVTIPRPVAVENHVLILRPKDGLVKTCRQLLRVLAADETSIRLNQRIRCRHLTVGALSELPWGEK